MKKNVTFYAAVVVLLIIFVSCRNQDLGFKFNHSDQGFAMTENGKPVLFYQKVPKSLTGEYICNNYIHPLYNLTGDTLTEEFPPDHPYHRGIFWTWHQLYIDTVSLGDGWINSGISQSVVNLLTAKKNDAAIIDLEVNWFSDSSYASAHHSETLPDISNNPKSLAG